jgi:cytochrome P450
MPASSRERGPVLRGSKHGGFWALSRFDDVISAANDHEHFTTCQGVTVPALGLPIASVPLTTDPPERKFYRRALQPFFTPAVVARLEDQIREIVIDRIESFAGDGRAELRHLMSPITRSPGSGSCSCRGCSSCGGAAGSRWRLW